MCGEHPLRGGVGLLLLAAALINAGCASLSARQDQGPALAFRPFSASAQTLASANAPLHHRRAPLAGENEEQNSPSAKAPPHTGAVVRGDDTVPAGWPELASSREVLAPFLACASPAAFVAMQRGVDMPRLVESLEDWDAVLLGTLGPLDAKASEVLGRKRAAFLVTASEQYGLPYAEVFALFVLHSSFDDELRGVVRLLAGDKQLGATLGSMTTVREELRRRGVALEDFPERAEQAGDVLRGLGRAGRDMLSSTPVSDGARYADLQTKREQLPPPYQEALAQVERALMERHFSPGSVVAGGFDHLTFGVPLGFYHLVMGTGHGAYSLTQGQYEQATRELAPAALMLALYAGGKGARALVEAQRGPARLRMPALDLDGLKALVERLEEQLGVNAAHDLLRYLQASREGARVAAEWGEAGVLALYEARGNPAKAQAMLAEAHRGSARGASTRGVSRASAETASEAAKAKLLQAELEASGPRLAKDVKLLKQLAPKVEAPPPGLDKGSALWREYVEYRERRLQELQDGATVEGPLKWEGYHQMRTLYARGLAFERTMVSLLEADAALPRAKRRWLQDFDQPRIETHVGVMKADLRFADVLVIDEGPSAGSRPRVETFSFKSRDLKLLDADALVAQMIADARNALRYYGGKLEVLRRGMRQSAQVQRIRLVYEGGGLKPRKAETLEAAMSEAQEKVSEVEVMIQ
ncbi:hypothetical protein COCOR_07554 [Corallococcus coralloides DSM 2259]|uniref:Uncharacterized protein n=1 Tax=Corallococcus coralloides (strain ATCC 25202 / DSM 2259 / NBRC 100086 / M2) TaxID=1144275 RepID=H8MQC1_CORCM|nr:hypothetical protein [Corallococcus coralloides]AFE07597.1 hypothetical protein COCOR_07554 [Corallococcus coralloides DSM 2259]